MAGDEQVNSGKNPGNIRGFPDNVRSIAIATFTLLVLYLALLMVKHLINLFSQRSHSATAGGAGGGGYEGFRKSRKKGTSNVPPAPPPAAPGIAPNPAVGAAAGMGGGIMGGGNGMGDPEDGMMTQGMETEKGSPRDSKTSQRLSRAADVTRTGFIILLGGLVLNALSFDASGAANALAWILFAFFVIWALLAFLTHNRLVPLIMSVLITGLAIAFYAVAFSIASGPTKVA